MHHPSSLLVVELRSTVVTSTGLLGYMGLLIPRMDENVLGLPDQTVQIETDGLFGDWVPAIQASLVVLLPVRQKLAVLVVLGGSLRPRLQS